MARRRSAGLGGRKPAPTRQPAVAPQNQVQPQQPNALQTKQPGFLSNVASTALGVGAGHILANSVTSAFSGSSSHEAEKQQPQQQQYNQQQYNQQQQQNPCQLEMENFFNCSQQQYDLSMCEGLNQALKECRMRYTSPSM